MHDELPAINLLFVIVHYKNKTLPSIIVSSAVSSCTCINVSQQTHKRLVKLVGLFCTVLVKKRGGVFCMNLKFLRFL